MVSTMSKVSGSMKCRLLEPSLAIRCEPFVVRPQPSGRAMGLEYPRLRFSRGYLQMTGLCQVSWYKLQTGPRIAGGLVKTSMQVHAYQAGMLKWQGPSQGLTETSWRCWRQLVRQAHVSLRRVSPSPHSWEGRSCSSKILPVARFVCLMLEG